MARSTPLMIWVVGDNTNVGKTTVSAALIRALNAVGKPTIGFKPYAGGRLVDVLELLQEIASGDGLLVGRDARKLAQASPILPADWLEVVNPAWRLSHPNRDVSVLIRKGSSAIGTRSFFHTENATTWLRNADFQRLSDLLRLPVASSQTIADMSADHVDYRDQSVIAASFDRLLTLKPEAVVCEGAGRLLPAWAGAPPARHLLFISAGHLHLFPNLQMRMPEAQTAFGPYTVGALLGQLKGKATMNAAIPLLPPAELESGMDRFMLPFAKACL